MITEHFLSASEYVLRLKVLYIRLKNCRKQPSLHDSNVYSSIFNQQRKTQCLSEAWWNVFLLVNHCISNLSHRSGFNPASFLSIALETLSMCGFFHLNALCIVGDFCLTINHTSFSSTCAIIIQAGAGPKQQGVNIHWEHARTDRHATDWWRTRISVGGFHLLTNILFPLPPNPIRACPYPGQPLARLFPRFPPC